MSEPRIGELFSGYGGLGMGVQSVYGGTIAWHSDIDKGACKILAHRYPDVPNIGDITTVDWSQVEPVDILTGGSPCQDLSHAGRRAGMTEGTRSNLWVAMREAIAQLRPATVVWENVRGAFSAAADSEVEPCAGCVGDGSGVHLRALGRVLGDLSDLGYDCRWHGLRAADVGAPHGRFRVFVVATDAASRGAMPDQQRRRGHVTLQASDAPADAADLGHERAGRAWDGRAGSADGGLLPTPRATRGGSHTETVGLLPTPTSRDGKGHNQRRDDTCLTGALLPTPAVNDMGEGKTVDAWDEWTAKMKAAHGNGNGHGASLAIEAQRMELNALDPRCYETGPHDPHVWEAMNGVSHNCIGLGRLLPTPTSQAAKHYGNDTDRGAGSPDDANLWIIAQRAQWGDYAAAIARWEAMTGRPAPAPTMTSTKGNPQLSPAFVEWMMGLPSGWVTNIPGITRNEALKALGNGVVPQQAAEALRVMAAWQVAA